VAYWFAKKRRADTGVPVGIIDCWWGGTSVTCWLDRNSLELTEAGRAYLREEEARSAGITMEAYLAAEEQFSQEMAAWNDKVSQAKRQLGEDAPWTEVEAVAGVCPWNPPAGPGSPYRPGGLYEHMLRRVVPVRLTGILYYQGEEDTGRTNHYGLLMSQLILLWRKLFRETDLPFLFVQLPGWGGSGDHEAWPRLRWQQEEVFRTIRNTGLAVTIDLGDRENIHPTEKRPVGERLAEQSRRVVDGLEAAESPRIRSVRWENSRVTLLPDAPVSGELTGFELRDTAGNWHRAGAVYRGENIELTLPDGRPVTAARYAWLDWPEPTLFGENGLPLAPWLGEA
jgi:sialate O-acetylesterase